MRIAVTGGIAEGKSTVLAELARLGFPTYSADAVAKEVLAEPAMMAEVAEALGLPLPLDRSQVRDLATASHTARRRLNEILHGPIMERLMEYPSGYFEVPLLIETCQSHRFDRVWVVTCGPRLQRQRLVDRVGSEELADRLLALQLPTRAKIPFADVIVRTSEPPEDVCEYVREQCR